MYLVINKCVTAVKVSHFSGHYLRNRSTWDIGVLGYIRIVKHKEHSPEVLSIPLGTPCISYIRRSPFNTVISVLMRCPNTQHAIATQNIPRVLFTRCGFSSSTLYYESETLNCPCASLSTTTLKVMGI